MEIKNYITKNLPNLNWNILPQIFEENSVELTEEIEAYLRNTPENTNWNIIKDLTNKNEDEDDINILNIYFDNTLCLITNSELETVGLSNPTPKEIYDFCELHNITVGQYLQSTNVIIYIIPPWPIEEPTNYVLEKDSSGQWGFIAQDYYWYVDSSGIITWGSDD